MVKLTIDGFQVAVPEKTTVLQAAAKIGIKIPTLCYFKDLNEIGACRVCAVEVKGKDKLVAACNTEALDGMDILTNSARVREHRRINVELILSKHDGNCVTCRRNGNCQLQKIASDLNINKLPMINSVPEQRKTHNFPLIHNYHKCINCMRCVQVCEKIQGCGIWDLVNTGSRSIVDVSEAMLLKNTDCALCGQCITHCPVNGLSERDDTEKLLDAIADPEKIVCVQIAPAVRAAWGEELGLTREQATVERLGAALRRLGVDYVFDTNFSADLTIMEEASEFLERLKYAKVMEFPMFTSCCPGWVRYVKGHYPEFTDQLSTAKSPQQMFGAVVKSYFPQILNVDPSRIFSVSIMPCLAKKHECALPTMKSAGAGPDVDIALTTREVNRLIRQSTMIPQLLEEEPLDMPLGIGSGAGVIFGATGGVMEAALRTAYYLVNRRNPDPDSFRQVRGLDGWKEATFDLGGNELKVAVVSGLRNTSRLLKAIKKGKVQYHFVEVMACPGGCAGGGGQPIHEGVELAGERGQILYGLDKINHIRFSHENPSVLQCYQSFLGEPLSENAHYLLHTDHHGWKMPGED